MFTCHEPKELTDLLYKIKKELKPNPNNWIIVNKWNYKYVWNKYRYKLFELIQYEINKELPLYIERTINQFVNIKDLTL